MKKLKKNLNLQGSLNIFANCECSSYCNGSLDFRDNRNGISY
ncbi:hypothetical protein [Abyssisolibacter fermentans]|nr:hypothetical protein [Abyssisolibacter fermentans]